MPLVTISVLKGRDAATRRRLQMAIHQSLVEAFGVPDQDHNIRVVQYSPEDWLLPPGKSESYTLVEIVAFEGRSAQAKGRLYEMVVEKLGAEGVPAMDVFVQIVEQPRENWGIRGGKRADLVDLGYTVKV